MNAVQKKYQLMQPILCFMRHRVIFAELICLESARHRRLSPLVEFGFDSGRYRFGSNLGHQNDLKDEGCRSRADLPLIS